VKLKRLPQLAGRFMRNHGLPVAFIIGRDHRYFPYYGNRHGRRLFAFLYFVSVVLHGGFSKRQNGYARYAQG